MRNVQGRIAGVSVIARDVSERHRFEQQLRYLSDHDALTGLPNRHRFEAELERAVGYAARYATGGALFLLDLDGFKRINDSHGHAAGDAVLRAVAMVLSRHVRASDLAARIGGDEFAVLLLQCDAGNAQAKALALEGALARMTPTYGGARLAVGASAGVAMLLPLDQPEEVLERADRAMYDRKRAGRSGDAAAE
jgi:diguanylate cyclase (GGDEF)-like protein